MVLQRDTRLKIWGWAAGREKLTITFNGKKYRTTADQSGQWFVYLAPAKAGGPFTMDISASNKISIKDILVGDVWLCSGQSNMVHQMGLHSVRYAAEIASANFPQIRQFWIPTLTEFSAPQQDLPTGFWKSANAKDVNDFSAVAYFFAREIFQKYQVPIGLINASVGGTPIEAWMSEDGLKEFSDATQILQKNKDTSYINSIARRIANANKPPEKNKGLFSVSYYDTGYTPKNWHLINVPGYWEDQGIKDLNGIVWYRKEINVPESMTGTPARVFLGRIVDADILYINGKQVGQTTYQYPQRRYTVPAGVLKSGKNIVVVKVTNNSGKGGFVPDKPYCLFTEKDTIDLKGDWHYKVDEVFLPQKPDPAIPAPIIRQYQPSALYNAMIAPLVNYAIKGFLWYQGEANTVRAAEYAKLQPAQITDWRVKWNQGELPFLYVQLPGFMEMNYLPSESQWAAFRESQLKSLSVPNTAMAVAIDLGEWNDIHPDRKKEVGERLSLAARNLVYGEKNLVYSGPVYQSKEIRENQIILTFMHTGTGLKSADGEKLSQFAIAGADKKFVWANAKIQGDKVVVWSNDIKDPLYVRYAWADNPDGANLFNNEGLPASPFRTDE